MKVGFIGLGQMGNAMAANLVKAGHDLTVWNRSPGRADPLVAAGAHRADRPVDAAQGEVVMTMLADNAAVETVVFGEGGITPTSTHFNLERHLVDRQIYKQRRAAALTAWQTLAS